MFHQTSAVKAASVCTHVRSAPAAALSSSPTFSFVVETGKKTRGEYNMQDADALLPLQHAQVRHGAARCCATGMRPLSTLSMKPQTNN